jgi:hypothetical protein
LLEAVILNGLVPAPSFVFTCRWGCGSGDRSMTHALVTAVIHASIMQPLENIHACLY